eukprot:258967_1
MANKTLSSVSCESCFNKFYDILGQIISILDVCTDIIVCVGFYQKDRLAFFGISLTIILLALIAYDIAFIFRFSRESTTGDFCLFFCLLPISPLLPFIFYFTDSKETKLAKFFQKHFCGFKIRFDEKYTSRDSSKLRQFMEEKLDRHFGFIIEALVEAFPQAILQMVAIVTYNEANTIAIISILLSMLSVSSKAFVFSIATAMNLKQLFFNWCCAVTDFFGVFFAVSWVFYEPSSDHLSTAFTLIRNIWFYKIFCQLIMIAPISIFCHILMMMDIYYNDIHRINNYCKICLLMIGSFFLVTFLWACGIIASILVSEITTWTYLAGILWFLGTTRFSENKTSSEFWFTMVGWVNAAQKHRVGSKYKGCTSFTKKQDKIMRVSAINYAILKHKKRGLGDATLIEYLNEHRQKNQYLNVTMSGIRSHTKDKKKGRFLRKFWFHFYGYFWDDVKDDVYWYWNEYKARGTVRSRRDLLQYGSMSIGIGICTFIFGPIYILTRFTTLFFAGFIILYLYFSYNVNIWNTEFVDMFQTVMITIYLALSVILSILFYINCCEQYLLAHFLPSESWIYFVTSERISKDSIKDITNHYYEIIVIPIRRAIVIEHFGPDLGPIILSYLPLTDHYENADNQVVKPKIVV